MKILLIFYSRTGNTRIVAEEIANNIQCDMEEIIDTQNRKGILGYLRSGFEAVREKLTTIKPSIYDPTQYDLIILGTPVWAGKICSPLRTYLKEHQNLKKVAFFCTCGSSAGQVFKYMEELTGKTPEYQLEITTKDLKTGNYISKVEDFIKRVAA